MSEHDERTRTSSATLERSAPQGTSAALVGSHRLHLTRGAEQDVLRVEAPDGRVCVSLVVTPEGVRIELDGAELAIRSPGTVAIDAERVALRGRDGLSLATDRDLEIRAGGVIRTEGHAQHLVSRLGDLTVYANDDVRISAERIKMNC